VTSIRNTTRRSEAPLSLVFARPMTKFHLGGASGPHWPSCRARLPSSGVLVPQVHHPLGEGMGCTAPGTVHRPDPPSAPKGWTTSDPPSNLFLATVPGGARFRQARDCVLSSDDGVFAELSSRRLSRSVQEHRGLRHSTCRRRVPWRDGLPCLPCPAAITYFHWLYDSCRDYRY